MPCLQQLHRQPRFPHPRKKPLRQGAGLQPDPLKLKASDRNQAISASGALATLASRKILPLASTTHTLEHSNDTSIPA